MNENKNCISFVLRCLIAIIFVVCFFSTFLPCIISFFFFFRLQNKYIFMFSSLEYIIFLVFDDIHNTQLHSISSLYVVQYRSTFIKCSEFIQFHFHINFFLITFYLFSLHIILAAFIVSISFVILLYLHC